MDRDPAKVGREMGGFVIRSTDELELVARESGAEIGVLAVPVEAAQENYDRPGVPLKNVDLRINLEELAFFLRG